MGGTAPDAGDAEGPARSCSICHEELEPGERWEFPVCDSCWEDRASLPCKRCGRVTDFCRHLPDEAMCDPCAIGECTGELVCVECLSRIVGTDHPRLCINCGG